MDRNTTTKVAAGSIVIAVAAAAIAWAVTHAGSAGSRSTVTAAEAGCYDPANYGAVPNDGVSDRVAIQAALDAAAGHPPAAVCLGAGTWDVERAPVTAYNRYAAIATHGHDLTITGAGPATVLRVAGDQGGATLLVLSIDPSASNVHISDLAIDTSGATRTDEQTHAIATSSVCSGPTCAPISVLTIERVTFRHPAAADGSRKGDCIRLLGGSATMPTTGVLVQDNVMQDCARSAVELQRGLHDVVIRRNRITCVTCDQAIDGEASGGVAGQAENTGLEITDNDIAAGPLTQGDYDITVTGSGDPYRGVRIHHNRLTRGIRLYRTAEVEIDHEVIELAARTADGVIDASNICTGLHVHDVLLRRSGVAGPMVRLTPHSGASCRDAVIETSVMAQNTAGSGVHAEGVSALTVRGNMISWSTASPLYGVYARATVDAVSGAVIAGNAFTGSVATVIRLDAAPYPIDGVTIRGNAAAGATIGLACTGAGGVAPVTLTGNAFGAGSCPIAP